MKKSKIVIFKKKIKKIVVYISPIWYNRWLILILLDIIGLQDLIFFFFTKILYG
jgi:hypothetical protein